MVLQYVNQKILTHLGIGSMLYDAFIVCCWLYLVVGAQTSTCLMEHQAIEIAHAKIPTEKYMQTKIMFLYYNMSAKNSAFGNS